MSIDIVDAIKAELSDSKGDIIKYPDGIPIDKFLTILDMISESIRGNQVLFNCVSGREKGSNTGDCKNCIIGNRTKESNPFHDTDICDLFRYALAKYEADIKPITKG